jgi:hypothetical protein
VTRLQTLPSAWGITVIPVMAGLIIMVAGLEKWGAGGLLSRRTWAAAEMAGRPATT